MAILCDTEIIELVQKQGMIGHFVTSLHDKGLISYGLSSYGYDARVSDEFKLISEPSWSFKGRFHDTPVIDPKNFSQHLTTDLKIHEDGKTKYCIMPAHSFVLATTIEYFKIPKDVLAICVGKSTYARCGIIVNVTPLEPEFQGPITIELSNTTPLPAKIYANEGICQFLFFKGNQTCQTSYKDRNGKYQNQIGVTLPKIL